MPSGRWTVGRLVEDVTRLGQRGLPRERYFAEVAARMRRVFEFDAACWHTLDPQTRLMTSDASRELVDAGIYDADRVMDAGSRIIESEYFVPDVNTFAGLAARRTPVGILSQATAGRPQRSTRYRELLVPSGIPFEMRAAFVSRGRSWGAVHLARRDHRRDFTSRDAAALASITAVVADGIRATLRLDAARTPADAAAPGLVVLGPTNEIELLTPPAQELLDAMRGSGQTPGLCAPAAVLALASFARRGTGGASTVAVPSPVGWITLHGSLPDGGTSGRVAIVLERSASPVATAVRLEAHGVTAREREIAALLARGLTNPEIASTLVLSPYTVQDHIKRLFGKTGVSSRQELVARMFLDDYLPRLVARAPVGAHGRFASAGDAQPAPRG